MATMPKCSGPTAWTRGVRRPLGLCRTKPLPARLGRAVRRRGMVRSFRVEKRCVLNPKGRGREREKNFFSANPHTTVETGDEAVSKRRNTRTRPLGNGVIGACERYQTGETEGGTA